MLRNQTTDKTRMASDRFGGASVEWSEEKKEMPTRKATLQSNELSANVFRDYLIEKKG